MRVSLIYSTLQNVVLGHDPLIDFYMLSSLPFSQDGTLCFRRQSIQSCDVFTHGVESLNPYQYKYSFNLWSMIILQRIYKRYPEFWLAFTVTI